MPQSSSEMYDLMKVICDSKTGVGDAPPIMFLIRRGYTLQKDYRWLPPTPDHYITIKEELCIRFLIEEWDFGGVKNNVNARGTCQSPAKAKA